MNETGRTYVKETIIKELAPKTIAVGTLTPPTYLRPISGGTLSSEFGCRWEVSKGVDWYVTQGTQLQPQAGTVTRAGWYGDYGYCVDITVMGTMTRYGHGSVGKKRWSECFQGQAIAASGNTGYTGPHLHFEIWVGGNCSESAQLLQ